MHLTRTSCGLLTVLAASCGAAAAPPPGHPGTGQPAEAAELTPESLGLPATPEPDTPAPGHFAPSAPAAPTPPPPLAGFYNHQVCPPARYGCVFSRTVTDERVTTRLDCPAHFSSYVGGYALRRLAITTLVIEDGGGLRRGQLLHELHRHLPGLRTCFGATTERVAVRAVIGAGGNVVAIESDAANAACVTSILGSAHFAAARSSTVARWQLDYTAEDPRAHVKPIVCP